MSEIVSFSKILQSIENELQGLPDPAPVPGEPNYPADVHFRVAGRCIAWIDKKYDDAWSKLLDQFDAILGSGDQEKINAFKRVFWNQIKEYIALYKKSLAKSQADDFFAQLDAGWAKP